MTEDELRTLALSPLDAALGLSFCAVDGDSVTLRLAPTAVAAADNPGTYLHGGTLATCVDTAGWYAVVLRRGGDWVAVDLRTDFLRLASPTTTFRVSARCIRAGRRLAVADVEIAPWDEVDRPAALGRVQFARTDSGRE